MLANSHGSMTWQHIVRIFVLIAAAVFLTTSCKAQIQLGFTVSPISSALYPNAGTASSIITGDFNGDAIPDVAILGQANTITVLLGTGNGTFTAGSTPAATSTTSAVPMLVVATDFNGDGKLDLATANSNGTVTVLSGNGDGTFAAPVSTALSSSAFTYMLVGDFNGDGKSDILLSSNAGDNPPVPFKLTMLLGRGDGTFSTSSVSPASINEGPIAIGDFNGDSKTDIVIGSEPSSDASSATGVITVLLSNGDGTFATGYSQATNGVPISVAVADFNQDGKQDIIAGTLQSPAADDPMGQYTGSSVLLLGNGDDTFTLKQNGGVAQAGIFAVADFNGDGKPDFAVATVAGNPIDQGSITDVVIELGDGAGGFTASTITTFFSPAISGQPFTAPGPSQVMVAADFNRDGRADLATIGTPVGAQNTIPAVLLYPPAITLSPSQLPDAILNMPYSQAIVAAGGTAPYTFAATGLPAGLTMSSSGIISGTPTVATAAGAFSLSVQDSAPGDSSGTVLYTLNVVAPGFSLTSGTNSTTLAAGQSATYNLSFAAVGGFNSPVNLTCSGLPSKSTCSFAPASVTPGASASTSVLTVTTTAATTSMTIPLILPFGLGTTTGAVSLAGFLLLFRPRRLRSKHHWLPVLVAGLVVAGMLSACGGNSSNKTPPVTDPGTPSGNYAITITATQMASAAAPITQSTSVTLIVQ